MWHKMTSGVQQFDAVTNKYMLHIQNSPVSINKTKDVIKVLKTR